MQLKTDQVEYLKSDNALLRNSLAYFTQIMPRFRARGEASMMDVALLSHVMLRFVHAPEVNARNEAETALKRLSKSGLTEQDLKPLTVHGELILELLPRVDSSLQQILAAPTTARVEALQQSILGYTAESEARAQRFRLLLYAGWRSILLGYLLHQFMRGCAPTRGSCVVKELQLIQANKMTALGTLVSGVAHEINNPNQSVLMNSRVLADAWDDATGILDEYAQEHGMFSLGGLPYGEMRGTLPTLVRDVHEGARRIERIIGELKDFSRPRGRESDSPLQLNQAVERSLRLLAHLIKTRTDHLRVDLAEGLPPLPGDAQHVEQIVVNLLTNARGVAARAQPRRQRGDLVR